MSVTLTHAMGHELESSEGPGDLLEPPEGPCELPDGPCELPEGLDPAEDPEDLLEPPEELDPAGEPLGDELDFELWPSDIEELELPDEGEDDEDDEDELPGQHGHLSAVPVALFRKFTTSPMYEP